MTATVGEMVNNWLGCWPLVLRELLYLSSGLKSTDSCDRSQDRSKELPGLEAPRA